MHVLIWRHVCCCDSHLHVMLIPPFEFSSEMLLFYHSIISSALWWIWISNTTMPMCASYLCYRNGVILEKKIFTSTWSPTPLLIMWVNLDHISISIQVIAFIWLFSAHQIWIVHSFYWSNYYCSYRLKLKTIQLFLLLPDWMVSVRANVKSFMYYHGNQKNCISWLAYEVRSRLKSLGLAPFPLIIGLCFCPWQIRGFCTLNQLNLLQSWEISRLMIMLCSSNVNLVQVIFPSPEGDDPYLCT